MHYGLLPRANRGIFAINELPDLAGKIQVGLFNIMQEGDVQIKGYPVRLPLDVLLVFTANPEDYTARGKIITPLKDRIGTEIRTHYPRHAAARHGDHGAGSLDRAPDGLPTLRRAGVRARGRRRSRVPGPRRPEDRQALRRQPAPADLGARKRRLERRAPRLARRASRWSCRASRDIYAALPSITGKFELEYEGELQGADNVARELIRAAVGNVFDGYFAGVDLKQVIEWFDLGGTLQIDDTLPAADLLTRVAQVQGLRELAAHARRRRQAPGAARAPRPSTSSSKASTRRRRSAASKSAGTRAPSPPAAHRAA